MDMQTARKAEEDRFDNDTIVLTMTPFFLCLACCFACCLLYKVMTPCGNLCRPFGTALDILNGICSIVSVVLYIVQTYFDDPSKPPDQQVRGNENENDIAAWYALMDDVENSANRST